MVGWWVLLSWIACTSESPPVVTGSAVGQDATLETPSHLPQQVDASAAAIDLQHHAFSALEIPKDSRGGRPLADRIVLEGWTATPPNGPLGWTFTRPLPIKPRSIFYGRALPGMKVFDPEVGGSWPYRARPKHTRAPSYSINRDTLTVRQPDAEPPNGAVIEYPKALEREKRLHLQHAVEAGVVRDPTEFVRDVHIQQGWTSHTGMLLPAPGLVSMDVTVPPSGVLSFTPGLAKPEFADLGESDGCTIQVEFTTKNATSTLFEKSFQVGQFEPTQVDVSSHSGQSGTLTFRSVPGESALYDLCFLGRPRLTSMKKRPKRVVMVFADTVRPDHLSLYGYERSTTPRLEAFAKQAAVFTQARSVAPWTLPSARSVVTGRHPEHYDTSPSLPETFSRAGFATGMIAGNVYLSSNFEMHRGWGYHDISMFPKADVVTDQALGWLGQHQGEDSLLLVHYMGAHLPYQEPEPFRSMWADPVAPKSLGETFILPRVRRAVQQGLDESGKQFIEDRYDQNLRFLDDQIGRLLSALHPDDIVVVFSDHGEEFWDHGGFEHGHTLFEELLRVPLVVRAPTLTAGRFETPVSLIDIAPTLLTAVGVTSGPVDGTDLTALTKGDQPLTAALTERPQTVGRPLYGLDRWGVIHKNQKWTAVRGDQRAYDLQSDPKEKAPKGKDMAALSSLRERMATSMDTLAPISYRFVPGVGATSRRPLRLEVHVPGGIEAAWAGGDPHRKTEVTFARITDDRIEVTWEKGDGHREVYIAPTAPVSETTAHLTGTLTYGAVPYPWTIPKDAPKEPVPGSNRLHSLSITEGAVQITFGFAPVPPVGAKMLDATSEDVDQALEIIGYKEAETP